MGNHREARCAGLVTAILLLAGCAFGSKVLPPKGNTAYGVYQFREVLANAHPPVTLEGEVVLLPDTVRINLKNSPCTYQRSSAGSQTIAYYCGDASFQFDRRNPLRENGYRVPTTSWQQRRMCIQTRFDPATGAESCMKYGSERVEQRTMLYGSLKFIAK